jgi:hypothetical protein
MGFSKGFLKGGTALPGAREPERSTCGRQQNPTDLR